MFDKLKSKIAKRANEMSQLMERPAAPAEVREQRLNICKSCENLRANDTCKLCNCFMPAKVWISASSCPDKKWTSFTARENTSE